MFLTKIFTRPIGLGSITCGVYIFHTLLFVLSFLYLGANDLISGETVCLTVIMNLAIIFALMLRPTGSAHHIIYFSWCIFLYFSIRLTVFLLFSGNAIDHLLPLPLTGQKVLNGLCFIVPGVISILLGIISAAKFGLGYHPVPKQTYISTPYSISKLSVYVFVVSVVAYFLKVKLNITVFGSPENWGNALGWIGLIFDPDVALLLSICWFFQSFSVDHIRKRHVIHFFALLALWLIFSILVGSRGGPLRILTIAFVVVLVINPHYKISIQRFILTTVAFLVLNLTVFEMGTLVREHRVSDDKTFSEVSRARDIVLLRGTNRGKVEDNVSARRDDLYSNELFKLSIEKSRSVITRLGLIDYPLVIVNRDVEQSLVRRYFHSLYPIKNWVNSLVPGVIFEASDTNTSRVFARMYRGFSENHINTYYLSEPFTIFGIFWIIAAYASLPLLFLLGFCVQAMFSLVQYFPPRIRTFVCASFMFMPLNLFYISFGFDHQLITTTYFAVSGIVALSFIGLFDIFVKTFLKTGTISKNEERN